MFELVTPQHRYVTRSAGEDILLLGARDLDTLQQVLPEEVLRSNDSWRAAKQFQFETFEELMRRASADLNPFVCAGFVLWQRAEDGEISVKYQIVSDWFTSITYGSEFASMGNFNMIGEMDEKQMLEMIKGNKAVSFLAFFPEWSDYHGQLLRNYSALCDYMQRDYDSLLEDSKGDVGRYCKEAKERWQGNVLINMRLAHHISVREYLALLDPKSKLSFYRLYKRFVREKLQT